MKKKLYKIDGMHCASCALMIESDLEDAGLKATCSYAKEQLEVEYDDQPVKEDIVADVLKKAGYSIRSQ
jgi:copper chaperone CopZ